MNRISEELVQICRFFAAFEREAVCCGDISVAQCVVLQALLEGDLDVSGLAGRSGSSVSATTRLVDGLARRGFVERSRAAEDRRRVIVTLTDGGRAEALRLRDMTGQTVWSVLSFVPIERRGDVLEALQLIRRAIELAAEAGPVCCAPVVPHPE